jgi:hypothetical protein
LNFISDPQSSKNAPAGLPRRLSGLCTHPSALSFQPYRTVKDTVLKFLEGARQTSRVMQRHSRSRQIRLILTAQ